ncbi:MAG: hypothetical protein ACI9N1_002986 [Flavobacteriales bacterium]|jgi:hypothetical protein
MTRHSNKRKIATNLFIGLLILNLIIELIASLSILINFPLAAEKGFGIVYTDDIAILGIGLGSNLALTTSVFLLSTIWTMRSKLEGVILGMTGAGMFILFSSFNFFQLGETQGLLVDGIRGSLTILFGYMTYKDFKKGKIENHIILT